MWKASKDVKAVNADHMAGEPSDAENLLMVSVLVDTATAYLKGKLDSLVLKSGPALLHMMT